jgi:hypothetical protein
MKRFRYLTALQSRLTGAGICALEFKLLGLKGQPPKW